MELWIRSQSKQTLMKVLKVYAEAECIFATGYTEFDERIGVYKTKERALEVLDEIENLIKPQIIVKTGKPLVKTVDGTVYREPDEVEIKELNVVFYQMPEE